MNLINILDLSFYWNIIGLFSNRLSDNSGSVWKYLMIMCIEELLFFMILVCSILFCI